MLYDRLKFLMIGTVTAIAVEFRCIYTWPEKHFNFQLMIPQLHEGKLGSNQMDRDQMGIARIYNYTSFLTS